MADKVFVSPGVYTSEKDLTFVTRQVGVTTLGLVGETTKGPAFQPIFISNYGEFQSFFGGLNNTLVNGPDGNGAPLYELPYIAKSYLSQSNQLFVTRILGLSGYYAGPSWGVTLDANLDPSTISATTTTSDPLVTFTATTGGTLVSVSSSNALFNELYTSGAINFSFLATMTSGETLEVSSEFVKNNGVFTGGTVGVYLDQVGLTPQSMNTATSGVTSGPTNQATLVTYTYDVTADTTSYVVNNVTLNASIAQSNTQLLNILEGLGTANTGDMFSTSPFFWLNGSMYTGVSSTFEVVSTGATFGGLNISTTGVTNSATSYSNLISYSYNITADTISYVINDVTLNESVLQSNTELQTILNGLGTSNTGDTFNTSPFFWLDGSMYTGVSSTFETISTGTTTGGTGIVFITGITSGITTTYSGSPIVTTITGITSGATTTYSGAPVVQYITASTSGYTTLETGTGYTDVEDKIVAILRSRGSVNTTTQIPEFQVTPPNLSIDSSVTTAEEDPLGEFALFGTSTTLGGFYYSCSFDRRKKNYLPRVLGRGAQDGKTAIFVEELFDNMFTVENTAEKIRGINLSLVEYDNKFEDYLQEYQPAVTPYFVSELRGNKVLRLFRFWTISDGNAANEQFKVSIANIRPDNREFDVYVRAFNDTDAQPSILEAFSRCTMDPTSNNFIGRRIGTLDGAYASKSTYILVELDETVDTSDAFPAGFIGFPIRDYQINGNTDVLSPNVMYKKSYGAFENKRKFYLGLSNTVGIDADFFDYKGKPIGQSFDHWTGLTKGFHMDINASAATIDGVKVYVSGTSGQSYSPVFEFETGNWTFTTEAGLVNGPYEKVFARKFTTAPYGGFDGWDIYRTRRTNRDNFIINGSRGQAGLSSGVFKNRTLSNGDLGINSDYYAYLEGIWSFKNPEEVNISVFATPGIDTIDNTNLVEAAIEMVEQDRADSLYIVTTPDTDSSGQVLTVDDVTDSLSEMFDSNYTATYWPWIQILDAENNVYVYVPPTRDVVRNIALTDNIAFPWFAVAGVQRGDVDAIKARKKLTLAERDVLYENRINPVATFTSDGIKIWGNKTLQVKDSALNRINVRRLLLQARKLISAVAIRLLFEQNDAVVRNQFLALVNPILENIRTERGLTDFRVVLGNDPEDIDRNQLTGKIYLKPTRSLEFIEIEFNIMNTGASFDNI